MRSLLAALLLFGAAAARAESPAPPAAEQKEPFKVIHVDDLARALASQPRPTVYDVNDDAFRKKWGVVPGAKLLSSCCQYSPATELPPDKKAPLVFYCANTH